MILPSPYWYNKCHTYDIEICLPIRLKLNSNIFDKHERQKNKEFFEWNISISLKYFKSYKKKK
jgi:hypothetical protein